MKKGLNYDLGYADFITEISRAPKRFKWAASLLNWGAGIAGFLILSGRGHISESQSSSLDILIILLHCLYFLLLIGEGSLDIGFQKLVSFFSDIGNYFKKGMTRLVDNILPFAVNIGIICFVFPWMVWGLYFISHLSFVIHFLERFQVLNPLGGAEALFGFFKDKTIVPFVISGSAVVINWLFFKEEI